MIWLSTQALPTMHIDPIQAGAVLAMIINAWLSSRKK
jgi:hypothetical protein